jgi:hypothetical protein
MQPSFLTMTAHLPITTATPNIQYSTPPNITDATHIQANSTQINLLHVYQDDSSPTNTPTSTSSTSTNDNPSTEARPTSPSITVDQLHLLLDRIRVSTPQNVSPPAPITDESIANLIRLETAASTGLTLKFDGEPAKFPSWIRKFRLSVQLTHWSSATKISFPNPSGTMKTYDLTLDFALVPQTIIVQQATDRWTDTAKLANLSRKGTAEFNIKLLCLFLTHSISDRYHTVLQNRAGDLLANDGQYLLWLLCTDIHFSSISYEQSIKDQIRSNTIAADYGNDLQSGICHRNN